MTYHMRGLGQGLTAAAFPGGSGQTSRTPSVTMQYAPILSPVRQVQPAVWPTYTPQPANPYLDGSSREAPAPSYAAPPVTDTLAAKTAATSSQIVAECVDGCNKTFGPSGSNNPSFLKICLDGCYGKVSETTPEQKSAETEAKKPNYMLWGGIALLVVAAGGGVYYYSKKKAA